MITLKAVQKHPTPSLKVKPLPYAVACTFPSAVRPPPRPICYSTTIRLCIFNAIILQREIQQIQQFRHTFLCGTRTNDIWYTSSRRREPGPHVGLAGAPNLFFVVRMGPYVTRLGPHIACHSTQRLLQNVHKCDRRTNEQNMLRQNLANAA